MQQFDIYSIKKRSEIMAKVKSGNTTPEVRLRSQLHKLGFRFRLRPKNLKGHPDIVLPKYKSVIFVHGCFWHQHNDCSKATIPKTNKEFWENKFKANRKRDQKATKILEKQGWKVFAVWECEINKNVQTVAKSLSLNIISN